MAEAGRSMVAMAVVLGEQGVGTEGLTAAGEKVAVREEMEEMEATAEGEKAVVERAAGWVEAERAAVGWAEAAKAEFWAEAESAEAERAEAERVVKREGFWAEAERAEAATAVVTVAAATVAAATEMRSGSPQPPEQPG